MGREGEKHQCVVASHAPPIGDLACNQACALTGNQNSGPFGSQSGTQSTEPHQPGLKSLYFKLLKKKGKKLFK